MSISVTEYIENMNYEAEDLIWELIDKIDTVPDDDSLDVFIRYIND